MFTFKGVAVNPIPLLFIFLQTKARSIKFDLPICEQYAVSYLGDSGRSCLQVGSEELEEGRTRPIHKVELRRCQADPEQIWHLEPASGSWRSSADEHRVHLENPHHSESLRVPFFLSRNPEGAGGLASEAITSEARKQHFQFVPASSKFSNVWLLKAQPNLCLTGGDFAAPQFQRPRWALCDGVAHVHTPYQRWQLRCVVGNETHGENASVSGHVEWLQHESTKPGGLEALERLPPWILLNLERDASRITVKEQFRALSRILHPDKQRGTEAQKAAERLFPLLQKAHSALKEEEGAEGSRRDAETDELLYMRSQNVMDLDLQGLQSIMQQHEQSESDSDDVVWVLQFYSSMCGMSRMIVPLVELAADEMLLNSRVRFAAFGCGLHGTARHEAQQNGFYKAVQDPSCSYFGKLTETPTFFAVGPNRFWLPFGFAHAKRLGERLVDFGRKARRLADQKSLLPTMTAAMLENQSFVESRWALCFVGENELSRDLVSYLPSVVRRLAQAGINMGIVHCYSRALDDCSAEGVKWYPEVRLYGQGRGRGRGTSLVGEPFGEARDFEIALQAMASTSLANLGATDTPVESLDEEDIEVEGRPEGTCTDGTCTSQPNHDNSNTHQIENEDFHNMIDGTLDVEDLASGEWDVQEASQIDGEDFYAPDGNLLEDSGLEEGSHSERPRSSRPRGLSQRTSKTGPRAVGMVYGGGSGGSGGGMLSR